MSLAFAILPSHHTMAWLRCLVCYQGQGSPAAAWTGQPRPVPCTTALPGRGPEQERELPAADEAGRPRPIHRRHVTGSAARQRRDGCGGGVILYSRGHKGGCRTPFDQHMRRLRPMVDHVGPCPPVTPASERDARQTRRSVASPC